MSDIQRVKLCDVGSIEPGNIKAFDVDGRAVACARIGDEWYAIDDTCSHARVSLAEGFLEGDDVTIECPMHGALFSLETGENLTLPATRPVASHTVEVADGEVFVIVQGDDQ